MRGFVLAAVMAVFVTDAVAQTETNDTDAGPCADQQQQVTSPDPAENPDGFGQLVGERGESNTQTATSDDGDVYTGDPAYGDCDGR